MSRILKIISFVFIIIILIGIYFLSTPIDLTDYRGWLIRELESKIKGKVYMQRVVMKFMPEPKVFLEGIEIRDDKDVLLSAKTIRIDIYLLPLLKKNIRAKKILAYSPLLHAKRARDGSLNISSIFKDVGTGMEIMDARIIDGELLFTDDFIEEGVSYSIKEIFAGFKPDYKKDEVIYDIKGSLLRKSSSRQEIKSKGRIKDFGKGTLFLDGIVLAKGMALQDYVPYIKAVFPSFDLRANLDISLNYVFKWPKSFEAKADVDYKMFEADTYEAFPKKLSSASGRFNIDFRYEGGKYFLGFKDAVLNLPEFTVNGMAEVDVLSRDERMLTIDVNTSPIPLNAVKGYIPQKVFSESVYQRLNKINAQRGALIVREFKYSSRNKDALFASISFKDAGFEMDGFKRRFSNFTGSMLIKKEIAAFKDFKGAYGRTNIIGLNANIKDFDKSPIVDINLSGDVDLKDILDDLKGLNLGGAWSRTFSGIKDANGSIALALKIQGGIKEPLYRVTGGLKNIYISHKDISSPLTNINGSIGFDSKEAVMNNVSFKWDGSNLALDGSISDLKDNPLFNLKINGAITEKSIKEIFTGLEDVDIHLEKGLLFACFLKGRKDDLSLSFSSDATKNIVAYSTWLKKPLDYKFLANGELRIRRNGKAAETLFERLNVRFGDASVDMKGVLYKERAVLNIKADDADMDDIDNIIPYLKREFKSVGKISFLVNVRYNFKQNKRDIDGKMRIKNAGFETDFLPKRVSNIDASARLEGNSVNISIYDFRTGKTRLSGKIDVTNMARHAAAFNIASEYLDIDDLYKPVDKRGRMPVFTGSGKITARDGRFLNLNISSFASDVFVGPETIVLKPISFINNHGVVTGGFTYFSSQDKPLFIANFKVQGCKAESIIKDLGAKEDIIAGKFNADIELSAKRNERIIEGIDGRANIDAADGRLFKFVVMSKIFSIVNIISIDELLKEGLPYRELKGSFTIKDGVISSEDLTLDSSSIRMSAVGGIDMARYTVDAKLGLHPFVTIDKIVSSIPLVGWIIGGKERSTITMYYQIKGPLNNPDVEAVPVKSLGTGIMGIFQRILESPVEVIKSFGD